MTALMQGFPSGADDQVTLANWRTSPFNRWAFHHVREIVPSADIANDPDAVWRLPQAPRDLSAVQVEAVAGEAMAFGAFIEQTETDGFLVLHRGQVVTEIYRNGLTAVTPHILMSVSKSLLGLLAGILADRGDLDAAADVTHYVPEVAETAYAGATVRQLLDMRAGVEFDEDYLLTSGPIIDYRKATNWNPLGPGETASDLRSFFATLTARDGPHGGRFHYVSPNTDLLAWVIERAAGKRYADLLSDLLWRPMGAGHSAYITVDRLGAPRAAGGVCVTLRDLARIGQLLLQGGRRGSVQVVPEAWIEDLYRNGDAEAWAQGDFAESFPDLPMRYRSKWYLLDGAAPLLFGLGIHGQNLFIDRLNEIVIAKFSSQAQPLDAQSELMTMRAVAAIREYLAV